MKIKDKVIIITGASQGIGRATAEILAEKGAKIVISARSKDALKELEKTIPGSIAIVADMTKSADIKKLIKAAKGKYGRIDVLINNAGRGMYGPVESIDIGDYQKIIELNVFGPLRAMEEVIPLMRKQGGGMIVNVSSRVSKNYFPQLAAYASTKYALNCLSLTARAELEKDHIVVSVMHPKMTATNFGTNAIGMQSDFAAKRNQPERPKMPDIDTAEDVAKEIAILIESEKPEAEM